MLESILQEQHVLLKIHIARSLLGSMMWCLGTDKSMNFIDILILENREIAWNFASSFHSEFDLVLCLAFFNAEVVSGSLFLNNFDHFFTVEDREDPALTKGK